MKTNFKIEIPKWVKTKEVKKLFNVLEKNNCNPKFVGGAVRNTLRNEPVDDIDVTVTTSPKKTIEILKRNNIQAVPVGIKFGSILAVIGKKTFDVTTLRSDIKTDGRHAVVKYTKDIKKDAARRDFTVNSIYMDIKGNIFDPFNGIYDLTQGNVKFIGSPSKRINEDYLRILRFFRFHSKIGKGSLPKKDLSACIKLSKNLVHLSGERIREELLKTLKTKNAARTIFLMKKHKIFEKVLPNIKLNYFKYIPVLKNLLKITKKTTYGNLLFSLLILQNSEKKIKEILNSLKFSNKDKSRIKIINSLNKQIKNNKFIKLSNTEIKKYTYTLSKEILTDVTLINYAIYENRDIKTLKKQIKTINKIKSPVLPIKGADLIKLNFKGRDIGEKIKLIEKKWIKDGFKTNKKELIKYIKNTK